MSPRVLMLLAALFVSTLLHAADSYIDGPLTEDFQSWLEENGYGRFGFARKEFGREGSYGGRVIPNQQPENYPVVFIHGNADGALSNGTRYGTGWTNSIKAFLENGYSPTELYATTWGNRRAIDAYGNSNTCATLLYLRKFLKAVLKYTEAAKVNIIAHSMGVTLARRIIRGGILNATDGFCNLGMPLNDRINTFIGIAGANYGLCTCGGLAPQRAPFCNKMDGFWPGDYCGLQFSCVTKHESCAPNQMSYSNVLSRMNEDGFKEADNVFALWTLNDEMLGEGNLVFGRPTSHIPSADGEKIYENLAHMEVKDDTADEQVLLVTSGQFLQ
ncbi:hypothetical protein QR680_015665 [Steinernema hermaphroditum]|uniref:Lipase domain-containing protein n=1 Tax=Steinernema hermaphroditum TaxID=289476 RepID=A0AA39HAR9_9BILA|nr:hypothetical protein QR680_015665 [Steinernema hermaphroditum]